MVKINKELTRYPEQFVAYLRGLELKIETLEREVKALKTKMNTK